MILNACIYMLVYIYRCGLIICDDWWLKTMIDKRIETSAQPQNSKHTATLPALPALCQLGSYPIWNNRGSVQKWPQESVNFICEKRGFSYLFQSTIPEYPSAPLNPPCFAGQFPNSCWFVVFWVLNYPIPIFWWWSPYIIFFIVDHQMFHGSIMFNPYVWWLNYVKSCSITIFLPSLHPG